MTYSPPSYTSQSSSGSSRSVNIGWVVGLAVALFLILIVGVSLSSSRDTASVSVSAERAIRDYYSLIEQGQYDTAWTMLSSDFNSRMGVTTIETYKSEWERSGPARIVSLDAAEDNDRATVTVRLHYPKRDAYFNIRYELVRDQNAGNSRFGYWMFARGSVIR